MVWLVACIVVVLGSVALLMLLREIVRLDIIVGADSFFALLVHHNDLIAPLEEEMVSLKEDQAVMVKEVKALRTERQEEWTLGRSKPSAPSVGLSRRG